MDFISGVFFVGIAFVLALLFFFGIAVWLEIQPQQNKRPVRQGARFTTTRRFDNVRRTKV
ncbi:MAG TPA: hypothetical protein VF553_06975 [Pyrinomonadaceae bacterium]|jgi:hypothetical protein